MKPTLLFLLFILTSHTIPTQASTNCSQSLEKKRAWDWQGQELFDQLKALKLNQEALTLEINQLNESLTSLQLTQFQRSKLQSNLNKKAQSSQDLQQQVFDLQKKVVRSYSLGPTHLNNLQRKANRLRSMGTLSFEATQLYWELGQFLFYYGEYDKALDAFQWASQNALSVLAQTTEADQKQNLIQTIYFGLALRLIDKDSASHLTPDPFKLLALDPLPIEFNDQFGTNQDLNWNLKHTNLWHHLSQFVWSYWLDSATPNITQVAATKDTPKQSQVTDNLRQLLKQERNKNPHLVGRLSRFLAILNQAK